MQSLLRPQPQLLLLFLSLSPFLIDGVSSQNATCQVAGAWAHKITDNSVVCEGSDACKNAKISGCDTVTCGERDCHNATIINSKNVICRGESSCREAKIGEATSPVDTVQCEGKDWVCYQATIFAATTVICDDNSGAGLVQSNGICGFAQLQTPCLQCIGTNHGCGQAGGCKLNGQPCPEYRYGGQTCEAACPDGEECKMNSTSPTGESSSAVSGRSVGTTIIAVLVAAGAWII